MSKNLESLLTSLKVADGYMDEIIRHDSSLAISFTDICDYKYMYGKDRKFIYANLPGAFKLGLEPREMEGRHWTELKLPNKDMALLDKEVDSVFFTGNAVKNEIIINRYGGLGLLLLEYVLSPVFDDAGQVEAVLCVAKDITDQRKNKERYDQEAQKLKAIIEELPFPLVQVDKEGMIERVNDAFFKYDFNHLNKEQAIGRPFMHLMDLSGYDYAKSGIYQALAGKTFKQVYLARGEYTWLMSAIPLVDSNKGEITGAIGVYENITEHEQARVEFVNAQNRLLTKYLNETQKLFQLIELCPVAVAIFDEQGFVEAINKKYHEIFIPQWDRSYFIGRHGSHLLEAIGVVWEVSLAFNALSGREKHSQYLRSDKWSVLLSAVPVKDANGAVAGALTIAYDTMEHDKLIDEMKKLDRLNVVGEMAAGVAHEIRNPMTVIKGYLQRFGLKRHAECPMKDSIGVVLEELARVEAIVTDFLSLANNKATMKKCRNMNDIIRSMEPLVLSDVLEHNIHVKFNFSHIEPWAMLDDKEIKQLLLNMTRNAIEAMSHNGLLTITTAVVDNEVLLMIQDTGTGIPESCIDKIFNPFYTSKDHGTGLGLAICASIAERHGGSIEVDTIMGEGTCFTVKFPLFSTSPTNL